MPPHRLQPRFLTKSGDQDRTRADLSRLAAREWKDDLLIFLKEWPGLAWVRDLRLMLWDSVNTLLPGERLFLKRHLQYLDQIERILIDRGLEVPPEDWRQSFESYWRTKCLEHKAGIANFGKDTIDLTIMHNTPKAAREELNKPNGQKVVSLPPLWEI